MLPCFTHRNYFYQLPPGHPFPMEKFPQSAALLKESEAPVRLLDASPAPVEDLLRVHHATYLEAVASCSLPHDAQVRLGLPLRPELLDRSRYEAGGTLDALDAALKFGFACNLAGGTHHAFPDRGLGYCVLNDVAIAIRRFLHREPGTRILVLDTDAHQGNGTNGIFSGEPEVFTYSIHVARNYPAHKTPGSLDVGIERFAPPEDYFKALEDSLPRVLETFQPELIFWIGGADPHVDDRFGQMCLTDADFARRDNRILDLLLPLDAPLVLVYGGGYNRTPGHTARIHADTVLRLAARL
jgi:acetoin utilization deacetylase AcuC-like enzyme